MQIIYEIVATHSGNNQGLIAAMTDQVRPHHDSLGIGENGSIEWTWEFSTEPEAQAMMSRLDRIQGLRVELYRYDDLDQPLTSAA